MISSADKEKILKAFQDKKEEVVKVLKNIISYSYTDETQMIVLDAEDFKIGIGFDAFPYEDIYEEAPTYYDENGEAVFGDEIGSVSIAALKYLNEKELDARGEVFKYLKAARPLLVQWLRGLLQEMEEYKQFPYPIVLTFKDDYPDHYDLKTGEYIVE